MRVMGKNMRRLPYNVVALFALLGPAIGAAYDSQSQSASYLVTEFRETHEFWKQFEVARQIAALKDPSILPKIGGYLTDPDRHMRANAAFVFAAFGDTRGLDVLLGILNDQSNRPQGQAYPGFGCIVVRIGDKCPYHQQQQIESDRYYAASLLGTLKDPRAVPALISVLNAPSVNLDAIWSLAEIDDKRAVDPLISLLAKDDPTVQVTAIRALSRMDAKEAIPALYRLLNDKHRSHVGDLISVGAAAQEALTRRGAR